MANPVQPHNIGPGRFNGDERENQNRGPAFEEYSVPDFKFYERKYDDGRAWAHAHSKASNEGPSADRRFTDVDKASPELFVFSKHRKKITQSELITFYRQGLYATTDKGTVNAVKDIDVDWSQIDTVQTLLKVLTNWAQNFISHDDGTFRYKIMALRYTLMHRAILKKAKKHKNKIIDGMPKEAYNVTDIMEKLEEIRTQSNDLTCILQCLHCRLSALELNTTRPHSYHTH